MLLFIITTLFLHNTVSATAPFQWGTATAAYQIEGAIDADGKLESIWDVFSHTPNKIYKNQTADIADDSYHRYMEDIQLMKDIGVTSYRLSFSWPRIIPDGKTINQAGIDHYKKVIHALLDADIIPFVTLYHWDLPQAVYTATNGGWTNETVIDYYLLFAQTVFNEFDGLVDHWITFNEPLTLCYWGYGIGVHAPGHYNEAYPCVHNVLLSHAAAYKYFKASNISGELGITLNVYYGEPASSSEADYNASQRFMIWQLAIFADPIWFGDYPQIMKDYLGGLLPTFTDQQQKDLKGSHDFFGLNQYSTHWVKDEPEYESYTGQFSDDGNNPYNDSLIGEPGESDWLYNVPWGMYHMIKWIDARYDTPMIYVTENGCDVPNEDDLPFDEVIHDVFRVDYLNDYVTAITEAKHTGSDIAGYFAWSLMDNFEWAEGFQKRFGLYFVNYTQNLTRYQKESAKWYAGYIKMNPNADYIVASTTAKPEDKEEKEGLSTVAIVLIVIGVIALIVAVGVGFITFRNKKQKRDVDYGLLDQ